VVYLGRAGKPESSMLVDVLLCEMGPETCLVGPAHGIPEPARPRVWVMVCKAEVQWMEVTSNADVVEVRSCAFMLADLASGLVFSWMSWCAWSNAVTCHPSS
jgi:hypothetical protein